jgi:hypothetical protein
MDDLRPGPSGHVLAAPDPGTSSPRIDLDKAVLKARTAHIECKSQGQNMIGGVAQPNRRQAHEPTSLRGCDHTRTMSVGAKWRLVTRLLGLPLFTDAENLACITVRQIIREGQPILLVVHDAEDGGWQFLTGGAFDVSDGLLVGLGSVVHRDPSLLELADLPLGWQASRETAVSPWQRGPCEA